MGPDERAVWGGAGNTYMSPRNAFSRSLDAFSAVHLFLVQLRKASAVCHEPVMHASLE
jgi:hypothetical protein